MKRLSLILSLFLMTGFVLAIQPVGNWTSGPQRNLTYDAKPFTTEGGNITEVNITQNISTNKWAGVYGNLEGNIVLANGTGDGNQTVFYYWTWTPSDGGVICAQPSTSADFNWANLAATTAGDVDNAFSFTTTDTDSATNTFDQTCTITISASSYTTVGTTNIDSWATCALQDTATPTKSDLIFCTEIQDNQGLYNGGTGDYELLLPTNEQTSQTETYIFWMELK